jgi:hypothetical protein
MIGLFVRRGASSDGKGNMIDLNHANFKRIIGIHSLLREMRFAQAELLFSDAAAQG